MNRIMKLVGMLAVFSIVITACGTDGAETTTTTVPQENTVLDLAVEAGQFSTLVAAIEAAGLGTALDGEGPFTVFAPTDAAFEDALEGLELSADELLADTELLTDILTYHVLTQAADSQLVATLDGQSIETLNGQDMEISVSGGTVMVNQAEVVSADLEASNGIVHVINSVLLPPDIAEALDVGGESVASTTTSTTTQPEAGMTITEILAGNEDFSTLLAAVEAAGLSDALSDPNATLTVFAPSNSAFETALEELEISVEDLLVDVEGLTDILLYHVLGVVVTSSDIIAVGTEEVTVETLLPAPDGSDAFVELTIVIGDAGNVLFRDQEATVTEVDIPATNGIIHIIDGVLIPPSDS